MPVVPPPAAPSTDRPARAEAPGPLTEPAGLTNADRLAFRLGLALLRWGRCRAERHGAADLAHRNGADAAPGLARDRAFQRRFLSGPR